MTDADDGQASGPAPGRPGAARRTINRVYSYDMVGSFLALPAGQVVAGPVAEAVGPRTALIGAAALTGLAVLGMLSSRDVRHLEHHRAGTRQPVMEDLPV